MTEQHHKMRMSVSSAASAGVLQRVIMTASRRLLMCLDQRRGNVG